MKMDFFERIKGNGGVRVRGVRLRMRGVNTTTNALSRFFILCLGIVPKFSLFFCEFRSAGYLACRAKQPADRNSQKKTYKIGGYP